MLTKEATPELIKEWQNIYYNHIDNLVPNRKTGCEIDEYLGKTTLLLVLTIRMQKKRLFKT